MEESSSVIKQIMWECVSSKMNLILLQLLGARHRDIDHNDHCENPVWPVAFNVLWESVCSSF